MATKATKWKF